MGRAETAQGDLRFPREADVDVHFPAEPYRFSGGNILNLAVVGAFLASANAEVRPRARRRDDLNTNASPTMRR